MLQRSPIDQIRHRPMEVGLEQLRRNPWASENLLDERIVRRRDRLVVRHSHCLVRKRIFRNAKLFHVDGGARMLSNPLS